MNERFEELLRRLGEIQDVEKAAAVLGWDEETKMPPLGAEARADQRATLPDRARAADSGDLGELLEELRPFEEEHDYESFEASVIRVARRDYEKAVASRRSARRAQPRGLARIPGWLQAREQQDYSILLPFLERNLELRRRYVECFAPYDDLYDPCSTTTSPG